MPVLKQVDANGFINLGGVLKVTAGYGKKGVFFVQFIHPATSTHFAFPWERNIKKKSREYYGLYYYALLFCMRGDFPTIFSKWFLSKQSIAPFN